MNKDNKAKIIGYFLVAIIFLAIGIGITYSYLAIRINGVESASTIAFDTGTMKIDYENNSSNLVLSKIIPGAEATKQFTLTGTNNTKNNANISDNNMYYKIGIVIDNNTFSSNALRYKLTKDSSSTNNGEQANNLSGYISQDGTRFIGSGYFASGASNAKHVYNLTISFPETNTDQSEDQGATFAAHIIIEQDRKLYDYSKPGVEFITNLYNSDEADSHGLLKDPTVDENIRYSGANPKNYVEFGNDGELWRIVGIFNVKDSTGKIERKIKLVRNESLGDFSWDATGDDNYGFNNWTEADLKNELNGDYLNTALTANTTNWYNSYYDSTTKKRVLRQTGEFDYTKVIKNNYQNMISESVWNIGGNIYSNPTTPPYGLPLLDQYNKERGTITYKNSRPTEWTGKVGLIYASDYGYASTNSECRKNLRAGVVYAKAKEQYDYTNTKCKLDNWLQKSSWYWTLSPCSVTSPSVFFVHHEGAVANNDAYFSSGVWPAVYLKSNILIIGGDGTSLNPYIIA